jgi:DNA primase
VIKPDTIDKIFETARIEEVVGDFVTLKKRGVNLLGLCPFHNEKTPSFTVSPSKGIYKCFGCGKGGNAVNFIMDHEHFTYPEALKYLANKYSIEIEEEKPSPEQQEVRDEKESLFNLTAFAQKYFEDTLHNHEEGKAIGLTYFKERGFSTEIIRKFGLGYCINSWDDFTQAAIKNGYKKEYLEKTSLSKSKDHQWYDTFRGRVIFPIHNLSGRVLGFGARILVNDKKKPKYINTAESEIYHKSKVLYGLYFAKSTIAKEDNCYLTEGYTDVISLYQAGIENVIASSGTSLTVDQIKLISRYTQNITLLFDGDAAGIKAAFRGIDMILEEGLNVKIVLFPDGEDPDSYARNYRPTEVKAFIKENANDFISFKTNLLLAETQNDPIRKAALIKEIAASISVIPEPIARSLYIQKSSEMMQVDERLLLAEINKQRKTKARSGKPTTEQEQEWVTPTDPISESQLKTGVIVDHQERELIRILLQYPNNELVYEITNEDGHEEQLSIKVLDFVIDDLVDDEIKFENPVCQFIFDEMARMRNEGLPHNEHYFFQHTNPEVANLCIDLLTSPYNLSDNWEHKHGIYVKDETNDIKKNVMEVLYAFKLKKLEKMIHENKESLREEIEDERIVEQMSIIRNLENIKSLLAKELSRIVTH